MATAIEKCKAAEEVVQNLDGMKFDSPPKKGVIARLDRIPNFFRKHMKTLKKPQTDKVLPLKCP